MEKQVLNEKISACIANNCGIEIYFGLKNGELRKANFVSNVQSTIKCVFIETIKEKILSPDLCIINYSCTDGRDNAIYKYDLESIEEMNIFNEVLDAEKTISLFSFENDGINNINFLLFVIGTNNQCITLYKKLTNVNVYKQNSGLFVRRQDNEFVGFNDDHLRIIPTIDMFNIDGELFILNLSIFEKEFDIHNVITIAAKQQIEIIKKVELLENPEILTEALTDLSFARKLTKIAETSPVLGHIGNKQIIQFTQKHPMLKKVIQHSTDGSKIRLTSKKSRLLFIKLLNDDYLTSDLTSIYYDSLAKDTISMESEQS